MGTTCTAVLLGDKELTIAHVGDSRAYRVRDGELTRLTRDHSLVGEMVRRGAISEAEAEQHPQRSILTRALGPELDVEVDTLSHPVRDGDIYLLCSDGLTAMVDEPTIAEVGGSGRSMKQIAEELIRLANENGGVDNITVVAFTVGGGGSRKPEPLTDEPGSETMVGAPAVAAGTTPPVASPELPARPPETVAAGGNGTARAASNASSRDAAVRRRKQTRRPRIWMGIAMAILVLGIAGTGAVVGSMNVYFLGTDEHGLVTVYRGLPYEFPLGLNFYTKDYVSTKPASELPPRTRDAVFDHKLRSRADALDLVSQVERGNLNPTKASGQSGQ
jgi:protein phosphatase